MCGNVCAWKSIFIWLHVNSKCLTLLELIPIKSFQRAAVCQSLTPLQQDEKEQPTNSISRTEQRRWCRADKTYNIRLRGWLSSTCRAKATGCLTGQNCGNSSKDHFSDKRMHLSGWKKKKKARQLLHAGCKMSITVTPPSAARAHKHSVLCFMHVFWNSLYSAGPGNWQRLEINSGTLQGVSSHLLTLHRAAASPNQSPAGFHGNLNPVSSTVIGREKKATVLRVCGWDGAREGGGSKK